LKLAAVVNKQRL